MAPPSSPASTRQGRPRASADTLELLQGVRRGALMALGGFSSFAGIDLYLHYLLYPTSRLAVIVPVRLAGIALLAAFFVWSRRELRDARVMIATTAAAFALSVTAVAVIGAELGGLCSPYTQGLAFYYGGTAALIPSPWRRTLVMLLPVHLVFFAVLGGAAALDPAWAWQWSDRGALAQLSVAVIFATAMLAFATMSGHLLWASRAQLFHARRLGRYRLQSPLGEGGMNEVWLARDEGLRRDVAIKILRAVPGVDDDRWRRFEREAQATSALTSPHTIKIFDYGASDDGIAYIAMEHLRGLDLDAMVSAFGALDVARAVHFVRQACMSLGEAHAAGLVHRDIKPANLFALSTGDEVDFLKVLDFGVVRELATPGADVTHEGTTVGTPSFMAPEQFLGGDVTAASDVYGLGATLYFLLTERPPFDVGSDASLWRAHSNAPVVPPSLRRGAPVPPALEAVIARCLAKHPMDRYSDGAALGRALDDLPDLSPWSVVAAEAWWVKARLTPRPLRRLPSPSAGETMPSQPTPASP